MKELAARRETFAFETTLAGRAYAPWIRRLVEDGYDFHLVFLWLPSPEMAVERVKARVRRGGHHIPGATIRRRHEAGLRNFFELYAPMAEWQMYDNTDSEPRLIAAGDGSHQLDVEDEATWHHLVQTQGGFSHAD